MPPLFQTRTPGNFSQNAVQHGAGVNHMATPEAQFQDQSLVAIGPLLAVLWARKILIALTAALFVGLALLYVLMTPSIYTANGVIVIDPRQVQILDSAGVLSGIGANSAAVSSQVEIIQSRTLVHQVFIEQGYAHDPEFAKPRLLSRIFSFLKAPAPASEAKIFNNFWKRLEVERQGLTYILSVSFESQDPKKAAEIVNAVIERYLGSQVDEKSDANAQVSILLSAQVEGLRDELSTKEAAVEDYKQAHNILNVGEGQTLLQSQIQQLSAQLVVARELARAANNRHQQVATIDTNSGPLSALFELLTDVSSTTLRTSYTTSSMALSSLQASLGPRHPTIQVAAAELARLENLIRNEARTVLTQIKNENELAQTNVNNAESALASLSTQNATSNQNEVELHHLERQADATRLVLEQLINREQETDQLENLQRSDARVISPAVAPIIATWPKANLLLAISIFFGVALGSAIALYLGPKKPRQNAQAHPAGQEYMEQEYAGQNRPMYHSSEAEYDPSVESQTEAYNYTPPIGTPSKTHPHSEPANSTKIWARRAAGEPYAAPDLQHREHTNYGHVSPQNPRQRYTSERAHNQQNAYNPVHPGRVQQSFTSTKTPTGRTRESFVTGLKKRLNQNAQN